MSGNARTSDGEFEDPDAEDFLRRGEAGDVVAEQGVVQPVDREIPQPGVVGGIARGERYGFGRQGKAGAEGFEQGLLRGPQVEQAGRPLVRGCGESRDLVRMAKGGLAAEQGGRTVGGLEVDPDRAGLAKRDEGEVAAVGEIEMKALPGRRKVGLAVGAEMERQFGGIKLQRRAEDAAEGGAAGTPVPGVLFEVKTGCQFLLGGAEAGGGAFLRDQGGFDHDDRDVVGGGEEVRHAGRLLDAEGGMKREIRGLPVCLLR